MTQKERITRYMKENGSISSKEAMEELGVMRLSAQIFEMKELGMKIRTEMEEHTNRYGERVRFARYYLVA